MNRKFGLLASALVAGGVGYAVAQTAPAQTQPAAMPAPADVKIETVSLAPGIYILNGRGGNVGLTVGVDGAAIIDDQLRTLAFGIKDGPPCAIPVLLERFAFPREHRNARLGNGGGGMILG